MMPATLNLLEILKRETGCSMAEAIGFFVDLGGFQFSNMVAEMQARAKKDIKAAKQAKKKE